MIGSNRSGLMGVGRRFGIVAAALAGLATAGVALGLSQQRTLAGPANGRAAPASVPPMMLGMNLGGPQYWSSQWTFLDPVQTTATLLATGAPGWPPAANVVPMDATGHPVNLPQGTQLAAVLQLGSARLPVGRYDCRVSPGWRVERFGASTVEGSGPTFRTIVSGSDPKEGWGLLLTAKVKDASLAELSCHPAGADAAGLFNPAFLDDTRPFGVLRFMEWMRTNSPGLRRWAARATPASFSQGGPEGVAVEHMVALANRLHADPWFTLPLDADPGYHRAFATYVRDHLDPDRRVYVELSNEVWNTGFVQAQLAQQRGHARYPNETPDQAGDYYYADGVRELMATWQAVYGAHADHLVRVLSSQAVLPPRADKMLAHKDTWRSVDALATAPYFATDAYGIAGSGPARVDALFASAPKVVDEAIGYALGAKAVARKYGLRYIGYEAGPDFRSGLADRQPDLLAAARDPRMETLYRRFLTRWKNEVGDLLVVFDSVSTPGGGNNFGHREYTGQPLSEAPKARAVLDPAFGARTGAGRPAG